MSAKPKLDGLTTNQRQQLYRESQVQKPIDELEALNIKPWFMWVLAAMLYCYQFVLRVSPGVMVPDLMRDFSVNAESLGILTACYYYAYAGLQLPMGVIIDRYGPRRLLTGAALLCSVGTLIFASAESLVYAQIGRFMIGAGAAAVFLSTLKIISLWFSHNRFSILVSFTVMLGTLGAMCAGAPLTLLVDYLGWREALISISSVGALLAAFIWAVVRDRQKPLDDFDDIGPQDQLLSGLKKVLTCRQTWIIAFYGVCTYIVLSTFADLWNVSFLVQVYGFDQATAGLSTTIVYLGLAVGGPSFAYISERLSSRKIPMIMASIGALCGVSLAIYIVLPPFLLFFTMFFIGFFIGGKILCFPAACEINPPSASGVSVGFTNMFCMLSGVIFQPVIGSLLTERSSEVIVDGVAIYSAADYRYALTVVPICLIISLFLSLIMRETHPAHREGLAGVGEI